MASESRLTVKGNVLDILPGDLSNLALTFARADVNNVNLIKRDTSKTITIPATSNNQQILGFGDDINVLTDITQRTIEDARYEQGGSVLMDGIIRIYKRNLDGKNNVSSYEIVIISSNGTWKEKMKSKNLRDLDFSAQDHTYNKVNIDDSELTDSSGIGVLDDENIVYPLINYGKMEGGNKVLITDRYPAMNIRAMFLKCFEGVGFKIKSTFIDSAFFKALYLPFTKELFQRPKAFADLRLFRAGLTASITRSGFKGIAELDPLELDDKSSAGFFDNGGFYDEINNFKYTVDVNLSQNFFLNVSIRGLVAQLLADFFILKNGNRIVAKRNIALSASLQLITLSTGRRSFAANDVITTALEIRPTLTPIDPTEAGNNGFVIDKSGTAFFNEVSTEIRENDTVALNEHLPDWNQLDFIQSVKGIFNLQMETNNVKREITIEPETTFFGNTADALNWTTKIDKSKTEEIEEVGQNYKKDLIYKYQDDGDDENVSEIEKLLGDPLASVEKVNPNQFVKGDQEIIETDFSPTLMDTAPEIRMFRSKIPKLWKDAVPDGSPPEKSTKFNFRILFYNGVTAMTAGENWSFDTTANLRTTYPYMFSVDEVTDNDNSLYFNETRRSNGLFEKYHRRAFNIISKGKTKTFFLNLDATDILNLSFRSIVFLEDAYYTINSIKDYKPEQRKSTQVVLTKIIDLNTIAKIVTEAADPKIVPSEVKRAMDLTGFNPVIALDKQGNMILSGGFANSAEGFSQTLIIGKNLLAGKDGQMVFGESNEVDADAKLIFGTGSDILQNNGFIIDKDGSLKVGGGGAVVTSVNDVTQPLYYTAADGTSQPVVMSK